jgi:hypothetical protein
MYGITYVIYFKIYHYLESYKTPKKPEPKKVKVLSTKNKKHIKKYMKEKYFNNKKFEITLSPIYE